MVEVEVEVEVEVKTALQAKAGAAPHAAFHRQSARQPHAQAEDE
jgi:hypothetical protein